MENPTVSELRSRSRSKTPFLRSSCDRESCVESEEHTHLKTGRRTPIKRSTPIKQLQPPTKKGSIETVQEQDETPPAHRTRQSNKTEKLIKTSDYSSEESLDRLKAHKKEIYQNEINSQYESVSSSRHYRTLADVTLSPISHNLTHDRSYRIGSPTYSACSTDSSFAEQALADASALLDKEPNHEHLPYRLYKMAGEYWNKYPKTDYTYSPMSRDRVELAPGQVAVPNMSRRSLSQFRVQGPNTVDEPDQFVSTWTSTTTRKRFTTVESSDDESPYIHNGYGAREEKWWFTQLLATILTTIRTSTRNAYRKVVGPSHRYPYTDRRPAKANVISQAASVVTAPFYWIYTLITTVITTTVTTVTETISPSKAIQTEKHRAMYNKHEGGKWKLWPLLLLLPAVGYGYYKYNDRVLDTYASPIIDQDADLTKRVAALESWALNVDNRFKLVDEKLSKIDNFEAQIEHYSFKNLQQNLIQILSMDDNSEAIASKLKEHFDRNYISKDEMQILSQQIHERLINSWKPDMSEDDIRRLVQEYLLTVEKRQMAVIVEKVKEYVGNVAAPGGGDDPSHYDSEEIQKLVMSMLEIYDADKTGLVDYALESAGGQVISTRCTELYQIKTKQYSILGLPVWWVYTSPRYALTPGNMPAECWAFQGFPGYLVIRTYAIIEVTGFSLEHMSRLLAAEGKIESAPKYFSVYGLHGELDPEPHLFGNYMYDANSTAIQHFPVQYPKTTNIGGIEYPVAYDIVELRVESNHGNPTYTCVYRFRVHGNPLNDIRQATDDSIRDSET
ncbi:klaroid protein-like isoform X1 [Pieris napi]|uniref:klaroid protein-like isoform X1 n=1 Tax=Pieris napi TaxID=78633 RepID=UPI001FBA2710|nr:klaroid protein-like isoform X1 [Pieris napi]